VLLDVALTAGIVSARYRGRRRPHSRSRIRAQRAAHQPALLVCEATTTVVDNILVSPDVRR
jgi:hypothetical protein